MTGPRELSRTASAVAASSGLSTSSSSERADEVERALDEVVEALEDRRLELEQRHRLAGHELRAVDEQLHRRRRDPHAHALRCGQTSTSSTACCCGKSGSAMMTSSMRWRSMTCASSSSVPSDSRPLLGRGVSEMKPTTLTVGCAASRSAWPTASMCWPLPTSTARRW